MAEINKPSDINKIWASAGDVLAPSDSKIATGWQVEIPPRQFFNYIDNKQDQAIAHINQHGVPVWDNTTEYQWSSTGTKSVCMGSNGILYRTKQTSINQNPVLDTSNTYWEVAFPSISDVFTQTQSDARYLQKSTNLSDLTNTATARTNLSVYSKTEVDSKTTVATALQSQQRTSDTALISALKLANAFQGANQNLSSTSGYQILPGGLTIQWGSVTLNYEETRVVNLAIPYTNLHLQAFACIGMSAAILNGTYSAYAVPSAINTITLTLDGNATSGGTAQIVRYFSIGV